MTSTIASDPVERMATLVSPQPEPVVEPVDTWRPGFHGFSSLEHPESGELVVFNWALIVERGSSCLGIACRSCRCQTIEISARQDREHRCRVFKINLVPSG